MSAKMWSLYSVEICPIFSLTVSFGLLQYLLCHLPTLFESGIQPEIFESGIQPKMGYNQKSLGARSGLYGGCSRTLISFRVRKGFVMTAVCGDALFMWTAKVVGSWLEQETNTIDGLQRLKMTFQPKQKPHLKTI